MRTLSRLRATTLALSATALFAAACDPTENEATPDPGGSPAGGEAAGGQDQPDSGAGGKPVGGVAPPVGGGQVGGAEPPVGGIEPQPPTGCDQPDEASCRAAGCNWTEATGCSAEFPQLACDQLAMAACIARADCEWDGSTCSTDPALMPCASLDIFACAERADCVLDPATSTCGPRPDQGCEGLDPDACLQRPECQLQEVYECDPSADRAPPPDNGGRPIGPPCPATLICTPLGQPLPGDCNAYAAPDACNADPACIWNGVMLGGGGAPDDCACPADMPDCGCAGARPAPLPPQQVDGFCGYRGGPFDPCGGLDDLTCAATPGCAVLEQPACPPCEPGLPCVDCLPSLCVTVDLLCAGYATPELCEADPRCDEETILIGEPACPENQPCPPIERGEAFYCAPAPGPCDGLDAMTCAATAGCHVEQTPLNGVCACAVDENGAVICECSDDGVVDVCVQDGVAVPGDDARRPAPGGAPDMPAQP